MNTTFLFIFALMIAYVAAHCPNGCSGHGECGASDKCKCYTKQNGDLEWVGPDCSERACPYDKAWIGYVANSNDVHPKVECSNKGQCDRSTGECACFDGYEGVACERTSCPNSCSNAGFCYTQYQLADSASKTYSTPWDATKHVGCKCDLGRRGPDCSQIECPSGSDVMKGLGNTAGRDCSGRGICDYSSGDCKCFSGYYGTQCDYQTIYS